MDFGKFENKYDAIVDYFRSQISATNDDVFWGCQSLDANNIPEIKAYLEKELKRIPTTEQLLFFHHFIIAAYYFAEAINELGNALSFADPDNDEIGLRVNAKILSLIMEDFEKQKGEAKDGK